jgi:hypothetical protein
MANAQSKVRNAVLCGWAVLVGALLAGSMSTSWRAIAQGLSATAEGPARISVTVPQRTSGAVLLDLSIRSFRKPATGNVGGLVRIKRPGAEPAVEVGRFSIFPAESFNAAHGGQERRFQFNISDALKRLELSGAAAEVEVVLFDRSGGQTPAGAELTIGSAKIVAR